MIPELNQLQLLRPAWLWALLPLLLILWAAARSSAVARWRPHWPPHFQHPLKAPQSRFPLEMSVPGQHTLSRYPNGRRYLNPELPPDQTT